MKDFVNKLRKAAGFSQEELSKKLGISRPTLIALEKGERDITLSELKIISETFDIPIEIILDEELSTAEKVDARNFDEKSFNKFHSLIQQCIKYGAADDGKITKTKLAKLVYLCDFASYYKSLKPISGFEYRRLAQGPVAIEFFDIIDSDQSVKAEESRGAIMISLMEQPDDAILDKAELALVKEVCAKWKKASTQEIVEFTHQQLPWKICKNREVIPYTLINNEEPENVY
ncbi:MAG: type II toxin-antitoxin system antitoxin SocA domain-containing protein [Patescibacteria group bacterium]